MATLGRRFMRKCVALLIFSVPKVCSAVSRRWRIACGSYEALLYGLQHMLMLPARDPPLLAGGAALFDSAALTGVGPVAA